MKINWISRLWKRRGKALPAGKYVGEVVTSEVTPNGNWNLVLDLSEKKLEGK